MLGRRPSGERDQRVRERAGRSRPGVGLAGDAAIQERAGDVTAVIDPYRDEDAAALAVMWNESNDEWPGCFNAGPLYNAARIRDWVAGHAALARLVARSGDRIVGYCDLDREGPDAAFIPLLNVHPHWQGQGVGRDLLRRVLREACADRDCRRVHLRTWPSNAGAVPLYKKTGFFWVPETSVEMVNYLPEVLRQPLVRRFLAQRDWYRCLQSEATLAEDGMLWHACPAFSYRFEDGDAWISVVIERSAGNVVALATPALTVEGWRERAVVPPGGRVPVRLTARAASGVPVSVTAVASGGVALDRSFQREPSAGPDQVFVADARLVAGEPIAASAEQPSLHAEVTAGDLTATVAIALLTALPADVVYTGERVIEQGGARRANFCVTNQLAEPFTLAVQAAASGVIALDGASRETTVSLELAAGATDGFDITIAAREPGAGRLRLACSAALSDGACHWEVDCDLLVPAPGMVVGAANGDSGWLANEFLAVDVSDGAVLVRDSLGGRMAAAVGAVELGPPFLRAAGRTTAEVVAGTAGSVAIKTTVTGGSGLSLARVISIDGPVVSVRDSLAAGSGAWPGMARRTVRSCLRSGWIAVPLTAGITTGEVVEGEYPLGQDYQDDRGLLSEAWAAAWDSDGACGFVASGSPSIVFWSRWLGRLTDEVPAFAPGAAVNLPPLRIYAGPGDWRAVRSLWAAGGGVARGAGAPATAVTKAELTPRPAIAGGPGLALVAENRRDTPLAGDIVVTVPSGWYAAPSSASPSSVDSSAPLTVPLTLGRQCPEDGVGAALAEVSWHTGQRVVTAHQPVFAVTTSGGVDCVRDGKGDWLLDNGRLVARLAPGFAGSLWSLRDQGRELLASAFPAPGTFVDLAPWHGGLHPQTSYTPADWPGRGHSDRYTSEPVEVCGARGLRWRGVRLTAHASAAPSAFGAAPALTAGLERFCDLLTLPGSNILAVVTRVANRTGADLTISFGFDVYPLRPAGSPLHRLGRAEPRWQLSQRLATGGHATLHELAWVGVGSGPTLAVVARSLRVDDYGDRGVLVSTTSPRIVRAGGTSERLAFLVSCATPDEAALYDEFSCLTELP